MTDHSDFWLTSLTFANGRKTDLLVRNGKVARIGTASGDAPREDCAGRVCLPAFIEAHVHLDKTFMGSAWQPHLAGSSIAERIRQEKVVRSQLAESVEVRGSRLIEAELAFGTGYMRSHVDIDAESGLTNFEAVLALRHRYADRLDLQIVAFPQSGILASPGTEALLDEALGRGADVVGGLDPSAIDRDPVGHLDIVFGLAAKHDKDVDIHLHEGGPLGVFALELICGHTERLGLSGRVAVSHAFCLGQLDYEECQRIGSRLAAAGVAILSAAPAVSMPPVQPLLDLGVTVLLGSDNIRDAWSPFGNGDMLQRASIAARQQDFNTDADLLTALDLVGHNSAKALRLQNYGIAVGNPADLVLIKAANAAEAVASAPLDRIVYKNGRRIAPA